MQTSFGFDTQMTGLAIAGFTALVIFGGLTRIAKVVGVMVPVMAGAYILVALAVTALNITMVPEVLVTIVRCAFDFDAVLGAGFGMALMTGIKRGLFSNEAGMGAVPNAAATADATHPAKQGLVQALGVYFDTLVVCTASAMLVLLTPGWADSGKTGIELIQQTLTGQLGTWTNAFMSVTVLFFAFSSIIGNYFYGEINMDFISRHPAALWIYRAFVVMMVYLAPSPRSASSGTSPTSSWPSWPSSIWLPSRSSASTPSSRSTTTSARRSAASSTRNSIRASCRTTAASSAGRATRKRRSNSADAGLIDPVPTL